MARTIINLLALSAALAPVLALPGRHWENGNQDGQVKHQSTKPDCNRGGKPVLPTDDYNNDLTLPLSEANTPNASLPSPSNQGLTLRTIALGLGTQNYTCPNTTSAPILQGARARLFNAEPYLLDPAKTNKDIPATYLRAYEAAKCSPPDASDLANFRCEDDVNANALQPVGQHHFNAAGTPMFDLRHAVDADAALMLAVSKTAGIGSPGAAYEGGNGEGAVGWLFLEDNGAGVSWGARAVYRVGTAGGSPPAGVCEQDGVGGFEVAYAAEYWFYE